ncbi:unnamed protein product [Arctia plantaginis]|uniref:Uncharacterized protein n=1 Tax=Arctia plantaginis TaxID=874455 RepID=A0A8S0ZW26_ARCPL|nr:unnamed protein product [Arctia plantaginis]
METKISVVKPELAKKKPQLRRNEKQKKKQKDLYSAKTLPEKPKCQHNKKAVYKCQTLTSNDIFYFHKRFYSHPNKISQDNYILQHLVLNPVKRKRARTNSRNGRTFTKQYFAITKRGKAISRIQPDRIEASFNVKSEKLTDVKKLLEKHFGDAWRELPDLEYYKNVLSQNENLPQQDDDNAVNDDAEYLPDEILEFV